MIIIISVHIGRSVRRGRDKTTPVVAVSLLWFVIRSSRSRDFLSVHSQRYFLKSILTQNGRLLSVKCLSLSASSFSYENVTCTLHCNFKVYLSLHTYSPSCFKLGNTHGKERLLLVSFDLQTLEHGVLNDTLTQAKDRDLVFPII